MRTYHSWLFIVWHVEVGWHVFFPTQFDLHVLIILHVIVGYQCGGCGKVIELVYKSLTHSRARLSAPRTFRSSSKDRAHIKDAQVRAPSVRDLKLATQNSHQIPWAKLQNNIIKPLILRNRQRNNPWIIQHTKNTRSNCTILFRIFRVQQCV